MMLLPKSHDLANCLLASRRVRDGMDVVLCRRQSSVVQQLSERSQVNAGHDGVGREPMAARSEREVFCQTCLGFQLLKPIVDRGRLPVGSLGVYQNKALVMAMSGEPFEQLHQARVQVDDSGLPGFRCCLVIPKRDDGFIKVDVIPFGFVDFSRPGSGHGAEDNQSAEPRITVSEDRLEFVVRCRSASGVCSVTDSPVWIRSSRNQSDALSPIHRGFDRGGYALASPTGGPRLVTVNPGNQVKRYGAADSLRCGGTRHECSEHVPAFNYGAFGKASNVNAKASLDDRTDERILHRRYSTNFEGMEPCSAQRRLPSQPLSVEPLFAPSGRAVNRYGRLLAPRGRMLRCRMQPGLLFLVRQP